LRFATLLQQCALQQALQSAPFECAAATTAVVSSPTLLLLLLATNDAAALTSAW
jgi:hypothetical protein